MSETAQQKIERLKDLNNRLLNLFWFTTQIATEKTPDTIHQVVVNGLSLITGIEKCSLYLVEPGAGPYEVAASGRVGGEVFWPATATIEKLYNQVVVRKAGTQIISMPVPEADGIHTVLVCPLKNSQGQIHGILCGFARGDFQVTDDYESMLDLYANQVSLTLENIELNRRLRRYAFVDPLTGLYNRRHFHKRLRSELSRADRKNRPVTLLMLDVDNFKQYNDNFGHIAGDRALKQLGALLMGSLREMDMIVRYGGEEFTVILPETTLTDGFHVAEQLRCNIDNTRFTGRHLTVSIGVATFPDHARNAHDLIEISDRAMYTAKRLGRNRVSTINPTFSLPRTGKS